MNKILEYLNTLPATGKIEVVKGGVFSRDNGEKFICENGHKNSIDSVFCEKCGINIKEFYENELKLIGSLKEKCNIIEQHIRQFIKYTILKMAYLIKSGCAPAMF